MLSAKENLLSSFLRKQFLEISSVAVAQHLRRFEALESSSDEEVEEEEADELEEDFFGSSNSWESKETLLPINMMGTT